MKTEIGHRLASAGARFLRIVWCDNANVIRGKAIHVPRVESYLEHGVGITAAQQALPVMFDSVVPGAGSGPVGEIRLMPAWDTLKPIPYAPGHVRVMGSMVKEGRPWVLCPRDFLRRMIAACRQEGFEPKAAFENEFFLLRSGPDGIVPSDDTVFAAVQGMDVGRPVIDDIVEALEAQDIPVELYYPESAPGQHELSVTYTDAMAAADQQVIFRETAHAIAARHGQIASFLPKVFENTAGNGCHLHFSLWQGEHNLLPDASGKGGLSKRALAFLAGILHHLPALMAITTPSCNSYRRIRPHFWSGAFRCWGVDNREAALRIPSDPAGGGSTHIELKTCDASANPYLALGAVLAAGLDGLRRDLAPGEPLAVDPGNLSEAELRTSGIDLLPSNLGLAIEHLSKDEVLQEALGEDLARAFLAVRRAEWEAMKEMSLEEEVKLLLERY